MEPAIRSTWSTWSGPDLPQFPGWIRQWEIIQYILELNLLQTPQSSLCLGRFSKQFVKSSCSFPFLFPLVFSPECVTWGVLRQRYPGRFFRKSFLTSRSISTKYNQRAHTAYRGSVILSLPALSAETWALSRVRACVWWRSELRLCGAAGELMPSWTGCVLGRKRDSLALPLSVL